MSHDLLSDNNTRTVTWQLHSFSMPSGELCIIQGLSATAPFIPETVAIAPWAKSQADEKQ